MRIVAIAMAFAIGALAAPGADAKPKIVRPFASGNTLAPETQSAIPGVDAPALDRPAEERMAWRELEAGLIEAKRAGKPLLINVYTDWCGWCKRMERATYADTGVRDYVTRAFVPVRLDAEEEGRRATYGSQVVSWRQFADGFNITSYPATLFLTSDGRLITVVPGFVQPERFLHVLRYIGDGYYRTQPWDVYDKSLGAERRP